MKGTDFKSILHKAALEAKKEKVRDKFRQPTHMLKIRPSGARKK